MSAQQYYEQSYAQTQYPPQTYDQPGGYQQGPPPVSPPLLLQKQAVTAGPAPFAHHQIPVRRARRKRA